MDCIRPRPWLDSISADPNSSAAAETSAQRDLNPVAEPEVGMEFESEDAAKEFYGEYARHAGFIMRIDQCRRSEVDKRILSRRLSCNKSGRSLRFRDSAKSSRKPLPSKREGCKALMLVKVDKSGKWIVTRFVKEHTHPLIDSSGTHMDEKDMKIEELRMELEREDKLCELYRGLLLQFMDSIDEQTELISKIVGGVVNVVTKFEAEVGKASMKSTG